MRTRVGVAEGDVPVLEALERMVGERDAIDIAREVAHGLLAAADLLDVNRPGALPHGGIEITTEAGPGEAGLHFRAKDLSEGVAWHQEARMPGPDPAVPSADSPPAVTRRCACG